ncbi:hypothetical protein FAZ19_19655 [Sphingobacterium alkalisoli]|uniref:Uncharacterized protein n=1 Tax=Sphingobacterium alkalisoli TaxID=1874115 RepID=A0A4U0GUM7_9SPHI|nr:hypothetical protein [Sphingobacterium alkalisoli]TJY62687.1 hypothetical protein FAZ19_19655 [Sphingobacterium alkalisoli]
MRIEITDGKKKHLFRGADGWNELSRRDLLTWCGILRLELTVAEAMDLAAHTLYRIPLRLFSKLSPVLRVQIRHTLSFLETNSLTSNVLGVVRIGWFKFHGPANRLSNITIGEFRRTELYYDMYQRTGQNKFLHLLAATLWRPTGGTGDDRRCKLSDRSVARRARLYSWAMHPTLLLAIKIFYEGCRAYIQRQFKVVYKKSGDGGITTLSKKDIQDLEDHILAYSGGKFGTFVETEGTNLYLFLKHMSERIESYEAAKKK